MVWYGFIKIIGLNPSPSLFPWVNPPTSAPIPPFFMAAGPQFWLRSIRPSVDLRPFVWLRCWVPSGYLDAGKIWKNMVDPPPGLRKNLQKNPIFGIEFLPLFPVDFPINPVRERERHPKNVVTLVREELSGGGYESFFNCSGRWKVLIYMQYCHVNKENDDKNYRIFGCSLKIRFSDKPACLQLMPHQFQLYPWCPIVCWSHIPILKR